MTKIKNVNRFLLFFIFMASTMFVSCEKSGEEVKQDENESIMVFKCKIDGVPFEAVTIVTQSTSGIISAKGLKVSNGDTPVNGSVRMTISFGMGPQGLGTGVHEMVGTYFETVNNPDNKNKAVFQNVVIDNLIGYASAGGDINVEKYYETTYWQGAKGTFSNISIVCYNTSTMESISHTLTEGEFDVKYVY